MIDRQWTTTTQPKSIHIETFRQADEITINSHHNKWKISGVFSGKVSVCQITLTFSEFPQR